MRFQERIPTTAQIRELEKDWIKQCGGAWGQVLMEIAGRACAYRILDMWNGDGDDAAGLDGSVAVICGRGNNGGDGLVIARYLRLWGVPVSVFLVPVKNGGNDDMSTPEANTNKAILEKLGVSIQIASEDLDGDLDDVSIIVDALLGTGLDRDLDGVYRTLVDAINCSGRVVVSVDIPTGINSDTGKVMAAAVQADATVTFGYLKPGLLIFPGAEMAGELSVVDIGLPDIDIYLQSKAGDEEISSSRVV
ncbi:MAG TPA: NAD(P)H-hydrate epimerase, partial [Chroococcales cyanobacterium]